MKSHIINFLIYFNNFIISYIPSYTIRYFYYEKVMQFKIGKDVAIHMGTKFLARKNFKIDDNSIINQGCMIDNRGGVEIGKNVTLGHQVLLSTADHDFNSSFAKGREGPIILEDYVFIGSRSVVLKDTHLRKGCVVGAMSLVASNLSTEEMGIYVGNPAKKIYTRKNAPKYTQYYKRTFF